MYCLCYHLQSYRISFIISPTVFFFGVGRGGANSARSPKGRSQQRGAQGGRVQDGAFLVACSARFSTLNGKKDLNVYNILLYYMRYTYICSREIIYERP